MRLKVAGKQKIFCIGFTKTGTTSMEKEMFEQGYTVGNQVRARDMIDYWAKRNFKPIVNFCGSATNLMEKYKLAKKQDVFRTIFRFIIRPW
ncbi:MAG: hypothetical protein ACOCUK_01815 [bacterium]